ncbi:MAG: ATPase [Euryarchaeota archaeon CG01_land_8_20_14_3_00_38_12]|nr:MAG: ATPase [Euryarchaeota archaeon CG01_land_8_20_14_3_00_38_12]PJB20901.1 MAG: ATPase [Euryarchaeota archaeon CG_4_9_14_3_um_filter_38_12]
MAEERLILKIAEAYQQDIGHGRARMDRFSRTKIGVSTGDIISISGKKETVAIVWRAMPEDEGKNLVRIDGLVRGNANVSLGDRVIIKKADVKPAEKIIMAPIISEYQRIQFGHGIENVVKKGMLGRPAAKGDSVIIAGIALFGNSLPFRVANTVPKGIVQITDETEVVVKEEPVEEAEIVSKVTYEDIGGLKNELQKVREMIELPLKHPEMFDRLGIEPPKGVLLHGPPGTGKTLIAKAVANESGASFHSILGPEIVSKFYGQSEENLRKTFEEAQKTAPSIVFIDEIDSIAPKREEVSGEVERRIVAQLLTLMDGLKGRGKVIVIAATNRPDAVELALRRPGRFDREIVIGVPDRNGRKEILQVHTRSMPLSKDFNIDYLADVTHGFVGADLAALAREAAMKTLRRYLPDIDLEKPMPTEILEKMEVTMEDFKNALKGIEPSALREVFLETPNVKWDDVGGLENVKQKLKEAVEWPLKNSEAFKRMGIKPPKGILLFGAPGTGKTLLAKAVATESEANFISVKGPELISKWVGESEKALREIFKKAKQASPSIVFLDELDAIAPIRGWGAGDSRVTERMVNQLLTSMDGMEALENVVVIGATNRPDILDRALLRAGRFDRLVQIPVPDKDARLKILEVHTKDMPLKDVSLEELAEKTDGYVGADIESLCREAALISLREDMNAKTVTKKHFEEAIKSVTPSVTDETVKYYERIAKELAGGIIKRKKEDTGIGYR